MIASACTADIVGLLAVVAGTVAVGMVGVVLLALCWSLRRLISSVSGRISD